MSEPLRLTVAPIPDEPPEGFLSRLAARNGIPFARDFCGDVGLCFQRVVDGEPAEVRRLADMAGADPDVLAASGFRREDRTSYRLRDQRVPGRWMQRTTLRACPACLTDDAASSDLPAELAMHVRATWQVTFARTCPLHDLPLIPIASGNRPTIHDFVADLRPHLRDLPGILASARPRRATRLERYFVRRLSGPGPDGSVPFLDALQASVAAKFCEVIGAVKLYGRTTRAVRLDEAALLAAGEAGFDVAADGEDAVRGFLVDLIRARPLDRSFNGSSQFALGKIGKWMCECNGSSDYDGIRQLLTCIVLEHIPLGPGDLCFGVPVERRILHSVRTAALETGVHRARMRKVLFQRGVIPKEKSHLRDNLATFRADAAAPLLAELTSTMDLGDVGQYINAPRVQGQLLFRAGFLKPVNHRDLQAKGMLAFTRRQVDRFMADLTIDVREEDDPEAFPIPTASKRARCGAVEIVRMLVDRKLPWVGRRRGETGYLSILVRPDDVRTVLRPAGAYLSSRQFADVTGLPITVVSHLARIGFLQSKEADKSQGRLGRYAIPREEVDRLRNELVNGGDLAARWGVPKRRAADLLRGAGVKPAHGRADGGWFYYRTNEVAEFEKLIKKIHSNIG